jgi:hypothetical protein
VLGFNILAGVVRMVLAAVLLGACFTLTPGAVTAAGAGSETFEPRQLRMILLDDPVYRDKYLGDMENDVEGVSEVTLYSLSADQVVKLRIPHANLSAAVDYTGGDVLRLYRDEEAATAGGEEMASVELPAGAAKVLLVLLTEDFSTRAFRVIALANDEEALPPESLRVINQSNHRIEFGFGEEQLGEIDRGDAMIVDFDPEVGYQRITLDRYIEDSERWLPTYSRHLQLRANSRITCLLLPRLNQAEWHPDHLDVYMIREFLR